MKGRIYVLKLGVCDEMEENAVVKAVIRAG